MKLILQPDSEYFSTVGEGKNFGEASLDLINKIVKEYAIESVDEVLFLALSQVKTQRVFEWSVSYDDRDGFTLTLED